jgi:hypothetical protein
MTDKSNTELIADARKVIPKELPVTLLRKLADRLEDSDTRNEKLRESVAALRDEWFDVMLKEISTPFAELGQAMYDRLRPMLIETANKEIT